MPYRPDRRLISVEEARAVLAVHGEPISRIERVALEDADQRVVARDLIAMHDVPPFARSMMDGYAVWAADTAGASREQPVRLRLAGAVFSGHAAESAVVPGTCTLIATGAPGTSARMPSSSSSTRRARTTRCSCSRRPGRGSTSRAPAATSWRARSRLPTARRSRRRGWAWPPRSG